MHRSRTLLLAAGCTAAGALGAGAIGSSAHDNGSRFGIAHHHGFPALFGAVHADAVVPRSDGTFATVSFDRGTVVSATGHELTIREGTTDTTYKTVDLNLPDDAQVFLFTAGDRAHHHGTGDRSVGLSDLQAGDRVAVWQSSRRTVVLATRKSSDGGGF